MLIRTKSVFDIYDTLFCIEIIVRACYQKNRYFLHYAKRHVIKANINITNS